MNIYVGNLPRATSEDALKKAFEQFGQVEKVKVIIDRETGESRGFAFVEMPVESEAQEAIAKMNGADMEGRKLNVNEAREPERNGGGGGRPPRFDDRGPRRNSGGGGNGGGGGFRSRF